MRQWLFNIRNKANITQEEIANKCGFTREFYTQIETNVRNPSVKNAKAISHVLGFQWTLFFEDNSNIMLAKKEAG